MKKARVIGFVVLGVCVAFIVFLLWPNEAVYQGSSIRSWAARASAGDGEAVKALKDAGSNAVPSLVHLLQTRESPLYKQLSKVKRLPQRLRLAVQKRLSAAVEARMTGAKCLGLLGPEAASATPALVSALKDSNDQVGWEAAKALAHIGSAAVPELTRVLNDPDLAAQHKAVYALGEIGPAADAATPSLIATLAGGNEFIRSSSAYSLSRIGFPAVFALSNVIDHGDAVSRGEAIKVFIRFYSSLRNMVPPLVKMAHSHVSRIKAASARSPGDTPACRRRDDSDAQRSTKRSGARSAPCGGKSTQPGKLASTGRHPCTPGGFARLGSGSPRVGGKSARQHKDGPEQLLTLGQDL